MPHFYFMVNQVWTTRQETQPPKYCSIRTTLLVRTAEVVETVRELVEEDPRVSTRMVSKWLDIPNTTVHKKTSRHRISPCATSPLNGFDIDSHTWTNKLVWIVSSTWAKFFNMTLLTTSAKNCCASWVPELLCWLQDYRDNLQVIKSNISNKKTLLLAALYPKANAFHLKLHTCRETVDF